MLCKAKMDPLAGRFRSLGSTVIQPNRAGRDTHLIAYINTNTPFFLLVLTVNKLNSFKVIHLFMKLFLKVSGHWYLLIY